MNESTRYGVYFSISAVGFVILLIPALIRFAAETNRPRLAIIAFASSWAALSAQSASIRFGLSGEIALAYGLPSECVRIAAAAATMWIAYEYVIGRIFTRHRPT